MKFFLKCVAISFIVLLIFLCTHLLNTKRVTVNETNLSDIKEIEDKKFNIEDFKTSDFSKNKVIMAWQGIYSKDSYSSALMKDNISNITAKDTALQVMMPTVFKNVIENGKVIGFNETFSENYLKTLKKNGYELHPTVQLLKGTESYAEYEKTVYEFLNNEYLVSSSIEQFYNFMIKYRLTSINIDFEALGISNKAAFSNYMDKLYKKFNESGIRVSVCVSYPSQGSPYFDFIDLQRLNDSSDYIILMAYDERVVGNEPGSTSSYNWVKDGIESLLQMGIDKENLILGTPLYSLDFAVVEGESKFNSVIVTNLSIGNERATLYKDTEKKETLKVLSYGEIFETLEHINGWSKVKYGSETAYIEDKFVQSLIPNVHSSYVVGWNSLSINELLDIMNNHKYNSAITYDASSKQDVLTYYKYDNSNTTKLKHKVWLENEKSIAWRKWLVDHYGLKGIAAWSLGDEPITVWNKLYK